MATALGFRINEVPHERQRAPVNIGDWIPGKPVEIRVSSMTDRRYVFLVALHEMVEYELCRVFRKSDQKIMAFDRSYLGPYEEPGDDPHALYHVEHTIATFIEKAAAKAKRVSWPDYSAEVSRITSLEGLRRKQGPRTPAVP